jgi:hypothetical protein
MKKQKMSAMSTPAQQAKSYPIAFEIDSYEEDGDVYDREKLGLRPNDPIFMKHDVPEKFSLVSHSSQVQTYPNDIFHSGDSTTGT